MKLFAGLKIDYENTIYVTIIDSSGGVLTKSKMPHHPQSITPLCSLLSAFSSAYKCPLILTISKLDTRQNRLIEQLKSLSLKLVPLNDSQSIKANFYKRNQNPFEEYDPYENAIELALLGALRS